MKQLLFFLMVLPSLAVAFPSVGDRARLEASYKGSMVILEKKIIDYTSENDSFVLHEIITYRGDVIRERKLEIPRLFLFNDAKIENVLKTCERREGAISLIPLKGQIIKVCEFYHEDSGLTSMIGRVPFGQVRFQEYLGEGEFLDFNLVDFWMP